MNLFRFEKMTDQYNYDPEGRGFVSFRARHIYERFT